MFGRKHEPIAKYSISPDKHQVSNKISTRIFQTRIPVSAAPRNLTLIRSEIWPWIKHNWTKSHMEQVYKQYNTENNYRSGIDKTMPYGSFLW